MKLTYNVPFEVTKDQFNLLLKNFPGAFAHRKNNDKYLIKLWSMRYKDQIEKILSDS